MCRRLAGRLGLRVPTSGGEVGLRVPTSGGEVGLRVPTSDGCAAPFFFHRPFCFYFVFVWCTSPALNPPTPPL